MYYIYYKFEYRGYTENYSYEIPFEKKIEAIRQYFDDRLVTLDGTDNAVWNSLVDFDGLIDDILDEMEDWLYYECKDAAYEEFKEYVDDNFDDLMSFMKDDD